MVTQVQCRSYAENYRQLGRTAEISIQRATILMAISQSWATLAFQLDRLAAICAQSVDANNDREATDGGPGALAAAAHAVVYR
jgi:hypothetical protein